MRMHWVVGSLAAALGGALWWQWPAARRLEAAPLPESMAQIEGGGRMAATMVGHEFRQDDMPAIAVSPDGAAWAAWVSFVGDRDDVAIRHWKDGKWGTLQWVPGTSGDSWMPQVGVDARNRVWAVWSQQVKSNWDLYARRFDPAKQEWGPLERLTTHALPDIHPRLAADGKGRFAVVWQGFRGRNSNIFLKVFDGEKWGAEVRVTNRAANDWEPAAAFAPDGSVWVAYDSYRNGNYDVYLARVSGAAASKEMAVAESPAFEARATVAADASGRVWVAWEAGLANWGKDQGYILRDRKTGVPLGGERSVRVRCWDGAQWREPAARLETAFGRGNVHQPHVFSDGMGSVWVVAKRHDARAEGQGRRGYWEYQVTRLEGSQWTKAFPLPSSRGRSSTRMGAALGAGNSLWLAWDTDNRADAFLHRPLRQQVYAGRLDAPSAPGAIAWGEPRTETANVPPSHKDEAGDLKALRAHVVTLEGKPHRIVRGDFHRHTELSWDGGGSNDGSLQDFYRYMIDAAAMDFGASTDHQGGAWPYWWWYTQKLTDMFHVPGAYAAIFGYERSALFPNGHRNMFFARRSESRVTPWHLVSNAQGFGAPAGAQGDEPGIGTGALVENDTKLLYEDVRPRNGLIVSHTSATRMGTDWRDNDPRLEPVVEIFQGARTNYEMLGAPHAVVKGQDDGMMERAGYQPEGMVVNAWAKGYKLGIISSSDHGSTHISYAMVYTADTSRQGVLDAIRKRRTYGAMDNILLDVRMGEHFMGGEFALEAAEPIRVKARGTKPIARIHVIKDGKVIYTASPNRQTAEFEFTDKGSVKGRHYYYVRLEQEDTLLAWSSPFFVNYAK